MSLKRRNKIDASFSMSSMTDLVFLLLLFFIMASTMSSPNDIKINLPQSRSQQTTKHVMAKVSIDNLGQYSVAFGNEQPTPIAAEELETYLVSQLQNDTSTYISLSADQDIAYKEVVHVLDIAQANHLKLVITTQKPQHH